MKRIVLFRHGKSDWLVEYGSDHDRPLQGRGKKSAKLMGRYLRQADLVPDALITSSAKRALRTAELANRDGEWGLDVQISTKLYGATPLDLVAVISTLSDDIESVVAVGHEPGWSSTVEYFTGARVQMPTAAMACIAVGASSWTDIGNASGELEWLVTPRMLAGL